VKIAKRSSKPLLHKKRQSSAFQVESFLLALGDKIKTTAFADKSNVFSQGEPAAGVFYILKGRVKLSVNSEQGKLAVIGVLNGGSFFGEGCIAGQSLRMMTATAITDCSLLYITKSVMTAALHEDHDFSEFFMAYVMARNIRYESDLVDQLFNSSEKRLARILILLSRYGKEGQAARIVPKINHETLAQMVGTTRPHISRFMNKFRKLGLIDYNGGIEVYDSLISMTLHD